MRHFGSFGVNWVGIWVGEKKEKATV
jgi:hypothetical protein